MEHSVYIYMYILSEKAFGHVNYISKVFYIEETFYDIFVYLCLTSSHRKNYFIFSLITFIQNIFIIIKRANSKKMENSLKSLRKIIYGQKY